MKKIVIDGSRIADRAGLFAFLKEQIPSEDFSGNNLDALYDALTSLPEPVRLEICDRESLEERLGSGYVCRLLRMVQEYQENIPEKQQNTGIREEAMRAIGELAKEYQIGKVILFGSRARGNHHRTSDIDLAVTGGDIVSFILEVEERVPTLLKFDVVNLDGTVQKELRESIEKEGIVIYEKI